MTVALPPTIYRANLQLADVDRGCYQQLAVTVARHPSETAERLVTRLLAYALWFEEGLSFTRGICAGDEPDLWRTGADGRAETWIEVGLPEADRIIRAARHVRHVSLLASGRGLPRWCDLHLPRLSGLDNLQVVSLDQLFLNVLAEQLERGISWEITVTDGILYLGSKGMVLESPIIVLAGSGGGRQPPTSDEPGGRSSTRAGAASAPRIGRGRQYNR